MARLLAPRDAAGRGDGARSIARCSTALLRVGVARLRAGGSACRRRRSCGWRCATASCERGRRVRRRGACRRRRAGRAGGRGRPAEQRRPVTLYESGAAGRRALPLLSRRRARLPHRQRQPPAAVGQHARRCAYLERIGALDTLRAARPRRRSRSSISRPASAGPCGPGGGRCPWWLLQPRAPRAADAGTRLSRCAAAVARRAGGHGGGGAGDAIPRCSAACGSRLPLRRSTPRAADASAQLFWRVLAETLRPRRRGVPAAGAARGAVGEPGRSGAGVAVAAWRRGPLRRAAASARVRERSASANSRSTTAVVALRPQDSVILAVPAAVAARLVPGLVVPDDYAPIVNAHFRYAAPPAVPLFVGLVGGTAEWVFRKREVVSVTVSAADRLIGHPAEELRRQLWRDVAQAFGLAPEPAPPARIVKERRATFRATPAQLLRRPAAATALAQPSPCGRLCRYRLARHDRRRYSLRLCGGGARSSAPQFGAGDRSRPGAGGTRPNDHRGLPARAAMNRGMTAPQKSPMPAGADPSHGLDAAIARAVESLLSLQHDDGHWVFELEADATIPAEYILLQHYLDKIDPATRAADRPPSARHPRRRWRLAAVSRRRVRSQRHGQGLFRAEGGGRPDRCAAHGARARGDPGARRARRCNVFTRILLALFGEVPWRAVPVMPVEIMLLPRWFPFHLDKISYWSRTVLVPLLVLMALRPRPRNPRGITISELFVEPPQSVRDWIAPSSGSPVGHAFALLDRLAAPRRADLPGRSATARDRAGRRLRHRAAQRRRRARRDLPGDGQRADDVRLPGLCRTTIPAAAVAAAALRKLLVFDDARAYCQPCLSPVWDTALACHALMEVGDKRLAPMIRRAPRLARRAAGARHGRRLGGDAARAAAGRLGVPIRQSALSRSRRHRGGRPGARPLRPGALPPGGRPRRRMGDRHAKPQRRLGLVRRRQHAFLSQPHPVRRSRRAARSADRRCHRALRRLPGAARAVAGSSRSRRGARLSAARAGSGRQLVRPLGHQLHLRHLVGAGRAQCRRRRSCGAGGAPRRRLAGRKAARRRRLGRGRRQLLAATRRAARRRTARHRRPPGRCSA